MACLGIAFKPDIDDLRESPALGIVQKVAELGCRVQVVEPNIAALPASLQLPNVELVALDQVLARADVVSVLVKHKPFISQAWAIAQLTALIDAVGLLGGNIQPARVDDEKVATANVETNTLRHHG